MTAKMIVPYEVTDANLTSTIAEDDAPAWDVATTYASGDQVIHDHTVWNSMQAANTGNNPGTTAGVWWSKGLSTNKWKVFDQYIGDPSTGTGAISWTITPPSYATGVAVFDVRAKYVRVSVTPPGGSTRVYDRIVDLIDISGINDYDDYFFAPVARKTQLVLTDLPNYIAPVTISVYGSVSTDAVSAGQIVVGQTDHLGGTLNDMAVSNLYYSRKEADEFGRRTFVPRGSAKKLEPEILIGSHEVNAVLDRLAEREAKTTVYTFDDRYGVNSYAIYGVHTSVDTVAHWASKTRLALVIEGII